MSKSSAFSVETLNSSHGAGIALFFLLLIAMMPYVASQVLYWKIREVIDERVD